MLLRRLVRSKGRAVGMAVVLLQKLISEINHVFQIVLAASGDFLLQHSFILDSGSSIHVSHDLRRFSNFRRAPRGHYAICGSGSVTIQGYGEVDVMLTNQKG